MKSDYIRFTVCNNDFWREMNLSAKMLSEMIKEHNGLMELSEQEYEDTILALLCETYKVRLIKNSSKQKINTEDYSNTLSYFEDNLKVSKVNEIDTFDIDNGNHSICYICIYSDVESEMGRYYIF